MASRDPESTRPPLPAVTIVVPVYNALPETLRCLEALARTVRGASRVMVIDDASPDPLVRPAIVEAGQRFGFEVLANPENLGFVGTCNRAFGLISTGHILLLNSDTEPQAGWLETMLGAAGEDVASVTAVSNNASIYSVPAPGVDPFSVDFSPDDLAAVVRRALAPDPVDIPVGVGFCLLLTRQALDRVGGFNPAFGMGYGEEDDWCMRATHAGFRHRLAPHAFVFHEGGASMGAAGVLPTGTGTHPENEKLLHSLHPDHPVRVSRYLAEPAVHLTRALVAREMLQDISRRRTHILHWIHADPWSRHAGGTERSVQRLVEALNRDFAHTVAFPDGDGRVSVVGYANGVMTRQSFPTSIPDSAVDSDAVTWRDLSSTLLDLIQPDVFHLHHGHISSPSVALAAIEARVPTVVSLHDFNFICPRNHLLDRWGSYCGVPRVASICDSCLADQPDRVTTTISEWRSTSESVLAQADKVIVPDVSVIETMGRAIVMPAMATVEVIPPITLDLAGTVAVGDRALSHRVLIPGRLEAPHKGGSLISELIERLVGRGIEVHSIGTEDLTPQRGLVVHGGYSPGDLPKLLEDIDADLGLIPSIVPETFSMTLSELWAMGVPVLAADIGALAHRIKTTGAGWVVPSADAASFANTTLELLGDPETIDGARARAIAASVQATRMAGRAIELHREIYRELAAERVRRGAKVGRTNRTSL
ncbi:MAG TPA: hypothetical protein DCY40_01110 [Actinobacteria bacterium]|nr:hypothetical protein [Actinomycetota bacterium]